MAYKSLAKKSDLVYNQAIQFEESFFEPNPTLGYVFIGRYNEWSVETKQLQGVVAVTAGSTGVVGLNTFFKNSTVISVGDEIQVNTQRRQVVSVTSNTQLNVNSAFSITTNSISIAPTYSLNTTGLYNRLLQISVGALSPFDKYYQLLTQTVSGFERGDINNDGSIDDEDASIVNLYSLGLLTNNTQINWIQTNIANVVLQNESTRSTYPDFVTTNYAQEIATVYKTIPDVFSTDSENYQAWSNMIAGKKITGSDVTLVIPRIVWKQGTLYNQYDDTVRSDEYSNGIYVYSETSESVYKCILNNLNGVSIYEPVHKFTTDDYGFSEYPDGYIWKYMFTVYEENKFYSEDWIPVPKAQSSGFGGSEVFNVNEGGIHNIVVVDPGEGYNVSTSTITVQGDGELATARISSITATGQILKVDITKPGRNYTQADIVVNGANTRPAILRAVLSPYGGHGFNPAKELSCNAVMILVKLGEFDETEGGKISTNTQFHQIGVLIGPNKYNTTVESTLSESTTIVEMTTNLTVESGANYVLGVPAYQTDVSGTQNVFSGLVVDQIDNVVKVTNTTGNPIRLSPLKQGVVSSIVQNIKYPDLDFGSGSIIHLENRTVVEREVDQVENLRFIVTF